MITAKMCLDRFGSPVHENNMMLWDIPEVMERSAIPGRIYCNRDMQPALAQAIVNLIVRNQVQNLKTWDGCFHIRPVRGGSSASLHSWGLAVDMNASWNGLGTEGNMTPEFVKCWTDAGFTWGGTFSRKDPMHFELSSFKD